MEASIAKAVMEAEMEQAKATAAADSRSNVTVSSIGRKLPPRPAWWKGAEVATMNNEVAAKSLSLASKGRK